MKPVIYLLDDNGEAYDILWFCSQTCRSLILNGLNATGSTKTGDNPDWIEDTRCEVCGGILR